MAYNLIDERWIPVERRSGKVEMIAPAQIVEREDPPLRVASPRPDFDGALLEFLIGLLQTASAPDSERAWRREYESPPTVGALENRLHTVREAFFLDGNGPRFMQDGSLSPENSEEKPPGYLLIDRCGEKGSDEKPSLFAKPGYIPALSSAAAAAAIYTMQSHAPTGGGGGGGHFVSLRGGAALSVVIAGDDLWRMLWLNVLPSCDFGDRTPGVNTQTFPWMGTIRGSDKKTGLPTSVTEVHPAHAYWALPRRLVLTSQAEAGCAVYGAVGGAWVGVRTATVGMRYEGLMHPLSPYRREDSTGPWIPLSTPAEGFSYRDWPSIACVSSTAMPPRVLTNFESSGRGELVPNPRFLVFGYGMDSMKPLRWSVALSPIVSVPEQVSDRFAGHVRALVAASDQVRLVLVRQLRCAWSSRPTDLKFGPVQELISPTVWAKTESGFYAAIAEAARVLAAGETVALEARLEQWLAQVHTAAKEVFDEYSVVTPGLAPPDLRRVVQARAELVRQTGPQSMDMRRVVGLTSQRPTRVRKSRASNSIRRLGED